MKRLLSSILITAALTASSIAQTASDTAKAYFQAFKTGEFDKCAALFHPDEIKDFRQKFTPGNAMTEEATQKFYANFFGPDATKESTAKLSDLEYFSSIYTYLMANGFTQAGITFNDIKMLGVVEEGETTHALARFHMSYKGIETEKMEVISFAKSGDQWKALLTPQLKNMAASFSASANK